MDKIWCIAYIIRDHIDSVVDDLETFDHYDVKAYIPTVKMLKKTHKGKRQFEEVPLLFNYGFFEIPVDLACRPEYLGQLRQDVACIFAWVKDTTKIIKANPSLRPDNKTLNYPQAAIATEDEIANLVRVSAQNKLYSDEDIDKLEEGQFIVLRGYPFENVPAEVKKINKSKKEVKVKLQLDSLIREVTVSFDNVLYTVYQGFDEKMKEKSLDELREFGIIDKLFVNINTP